MTLTTSLGETGADVADRRPVAIIGAGGHGRVVASCLRAAGMTVAGFWDDDLAKVGRRVDDAIVHGVVIELSGSGLPAIIAIGDNRVRQTIADALSLDWVTVVHPAAWVDPTAVVGIGTVICAGAIVQPGAVIGSHAIVNSHAGVDHDAHLADFAHISAAHLGAGSSTGQGAFLGLGCVVLPYHRVGAWATIGAGAVVTHDVLDGVTVVGNPARPLVGTDGVGRVPIDVSRRHGTLPSRSVRSSSPRTPQLEDQDPVSAVMVLRGQRQRLTITGSGGFAVRRLPGDRPRWFAYSLSIAIALLLAVALINEVDLLWF